MGTLMIEQLIMTLNAMIGGESISEWLHALYSFGAYIQESFPGISADASTLNTFKSHFAKLLPLAEHNALLLQVLLQLKEQHSGDAYYVATMQTMLIALGCYKYARTNLKGNNGQDAIVYGSSKKLLPKAHSFKINVLEFIETTRKHNLLKKINDHAAYLENLSESFSGDRKHRNDKKVARLVDLYDSSSEDLNLACAQIYSEFETIVSITHAQNVEPVSARDELIIGMKKILPALRKLERVSVGDKKDALQQLISDVVTINRTAQTDSTLSVPQLKLKYYNVLETAKPALNVHRDPLLTRIFSQAFRLIGYALSLGTLYAWERNQEHRSAPAWSAKAKTYCTTEEKFLEVLGAKPMALAF
jgi:hypothetical protein